jgi:hypothetical protein
MLIYHRRLNHAVQYQILRIAVGMFELGDIDDSNASMAGFHASEMDVSLNSMH